MHFLELLFVSWEVAAERVEGAHVVWKEEISALPFIHLFILQTDGGM